MLKLRHQCNGSKRILRTMLPSIGTVSPPNKIGWSNKISETSVGLFYLYKVSCVSASFASDTR